MDEQNNTPNIQPTQTPQPISPPIPSSVTQSDLDPVPTAAPTSMPPISPPPGETMVNVGTIANESPASTKKPLLILGSIMLVLLVVGVGYLAYRDSNHATSNKTKSATAASVATWQPVTAADTACMSSYKDTNLCHFFASWTLTSVAHTEATTGTSSSTTEVFDGKGNASYTGSLLTAILLNGKVYDGGGTASGYIEYPSTSVAPALDVALTTEGLTKLIAEDNPAITYKKVNTEACGNLTCFKYQVLNTTPTESTETQYMWFDNKGFMLRKYSTSRAATTSTEKMSNGTTATSSSPAESSTTTISYAPVTISAPPANVTFPANN